MSLPQGNWNINSVDKSGSVMSTPAATITAGSETTITQQPKSDYLDDLVAVLETMPYVNIYLDFGKKSINIDNSITSSLRFPLSWGGKTFGQSFYHTVFPMKRVVLL